MPKIRQLSETLAKKARDELHEKPDQIEDRIKELRTWIQMQPHLKARTGQFSSFIHERIFFLNFFRFLFQMINSW